MWNKYFTSTLWEPTSVLCDENPFGDLSAPTSPLRSETSPLFLDASRRLHRRRPLCSGRRTLLVSSPRIRRRGLSVEGRSGCEGALRAAAAAPPRPPVECQMSLSEKRPRSPLPGGTEQRAQLGDLGSRAPCSCGGVRIVSASQR